MKSRAAKPSAFFTSITAALPSGDSASPRTCSVRSTRVRRRRTNPASGATAPGATSARPCDRVAAAVPACGFSVEPGAGLRSHPDDHAPPGPMPGAAAVLSARSPLNPVVMPMLPMPRLRRWPTCTCPASRTASSTSAFIWKVPTLRCGGGLDAQRFQRVELLAADRLPRVRDHRRRFRVVLTRRVRWSGWRARRGDRDERNQPDGRSSDSHVRVPFCSRSGLKPDATESGPC